MLLSDDLVLVKNHEKDPLRFRYDGKTYLIPARGSIHVPFEVIKKEFGDPRSGEKLHVAKDPKGDKVRIASRSEELARMTTKWGVGVRQLEEKRVVPFEEVVPKITVTGPDGEKILTVVQDPFGDHAEEIPIDADSPEALNARIAQMQKQLDILVRQSKAAEREAPEGEDEVTEDSPVGAGV